MEEWHAYKIGRARCARRPGSLQQKVPKAWRNIEPRIEIEDSQVARRSGHRIVS